LKFGNEYQIGKTMSPAMMPTTNIRSTKSEARNSKQFQMFKKPENFKQPQFGFRVLDFLWFWVYLTAVCFGFRASDFGVYFAGALARENLEPVLSNKLQDRI